MNLNKIRPKHDTKDLLLSITENCEALTKQTHRKTEETLNPNLTNQEKYFISIHQSQLNDFGCYN